MRRFVPLLILWSLATFAQTRVSRCYETCNAYVEDPRLRATTCATCLRLKDDPHPWLALMPAVPPRMTEDGAWEIRWAALQALGQRAKSTGDAQLAAWVARSKGDEQLRACLTSAHVSSPRLPGCRARTDEVRAALEVELYAENATVRREALRALSSAFAMPRARVVLDVLPSRPATFDAIIFDTLADDDAAVAQLVASAGPRDVEAMNRLLAVVSARRDEARVNLQTGDRAHRLEAIHALRALLPVSEPELLTVLTFDDVHLRSAAVRAIAGAEKRSVSRMAQARFNGEKPATEDQQRALLELLGDVHDKDCAPVALEQWKKSGPLQLTSLRIAASCSWPVAAPEVEFAFRDESLEKRAAALEALASAPTTPQLKERLRIGTLAPDKELRAAAVRAIGLRRWHGGLERVSALVADPEPVVRVEALKTWRALDGPGAEAKLAKALKTDVSPDVRRAAAESLAMTGGPLAQSALEEALKTETDSSVKMVVERALRRIR